ncbi:MAG: ParB/RepB/Spo0J family partition protein [Candidatus Cloacimonetes bacterium]|nr:ParB/RepB/Spo0J family partition protein [Candidatus Cloacimonadota bacterium]
MSKLGRGLDALLNTGPESTDSTTGITTVGVEYIFPNSYQPRKHFDAAKLEELAQSLRENGMIQPIIVTRNDNSRYELIAGERRLEAAKLAGFAEVPVIVRSVSRRQQLQFAIIENIQREDLNPVEEAHAYQQLHEEFSLTHAEISDIVGKDRATVSNSLRLLKLQPAVLDMLLQGVITPGHARAVLQAPETEREAFARHIAARRLSVRKAELLVKSWGPAQPADEAPRAPLGKQLLEQLQNTLHNWYNVRVNIQGKPTKGRITFYYQSEEERVALLERLQHSREDKSEVT